MSRFRVIAMAAAAVALASAGVALASGPPPTPPQPPDPQTVVAHGSASIKVVAPRKRSDATISAAVSAARTKAYAPAVADARSEATLLAGAAGLTVGPAIGIARDVNPYGYYDPDEGRFGPGRWCGPIFTRKTIHRGGRTIRVTRSHHGCSVPRQVTMRVTLTFATA